MKILTGIIIFFYTLLFVAVGSLIISFALGYITPQTIIDLFGHIPSDFNIRMLIGLTGAAIIVISLAIMQLAFGTSRQEKSITIDNQNGQVTVSLSAIEDFVKRLGREFKEIQELRPSVKTTKSNLIITCKVYLLQNLSIPEITRDIQETVKTRVNKLLGNAEDIMVKIDVVKIVEKDKNAQKKGQDEELSAPFQYKAVLSDLTIFRKGACYGKKNWSFNGWR